MSHDFESNPAEKAMEDLLKKHYITEKEQLLSEVIAGALLDGQNQIHDLYKEKATSEEVSYRMKRSHAYWLDRLHKILSFQENV